jgi:thiol:disulfide interchange protein DsbC
MNKILILPALLCGFLSLNANAKSTLTNEQIINHFKSQVMLDNLSVVLKDRQQVPSFPDFEFAVVEVGYASDDSKAQKIEILISGDFIFPEAVDVKQNISLREKVEDKLLHDRLTSIYKNELKSNIISLGDAKKPALVIFSDPECPYCREELADIENRLKTNSVKIILTSVHEVSALEKSVLIYEESAKAKNDKQKIAILRKYYDENAIVTTKVTDAKIKKLDDLRQKYFKAGLESVPLVIEEKDILGK